MITKNDIKLFKDFKHLNYLTKKFNYLIAFDTETSGLKSREDFIIEIGAVKISKDQFIYSLQNPEKTINFSEENIFDVLINPQIEISNFIQNLTGITPEMLKEGVSPDTGIKQFLNFISEDSVLLAHNAPFDLYFINNQLERSGLKPIKNLCVDTLPLSRWALAEKDKIYEPGSFKLQTLARNLNINVEAAHRAYDDSKVCMELFKKIYYKTAINREELLQGQLALTFETP